VQNGDAKEESGRRGSMRGEERRRRGGRWSEIGKDSLKERLRTC
jgi:hypothetical protein